MGDAAYHIISQDATLVLPFLAIHHPLEGKLLVCIQSIPELFRGTDAVFLGDVLIRPDIGKKVLDFLGCLSGVIVQIFVVRPQVGTQGVAQSIEAVGPVNVVCQVDNIGQITTGRDLRRRSS